MYSFWSCKDPVQHLTAALSIVYLVDLLLAGAGLVLCIALIQRKSVALSKARLLLRIAAGWSVFNGLLVLMNPELREVLSDYLSWFP